jgi:DNA-binding transcriptional MerR regulator
VTSKLYKAADVCESTGLQLYVLRSWEKEFPGIGVQRSQDSPRLYRQSDVEQVLRIKQLVFGEGLTLAGARRRLEEASPRLADVRAAERAEVLDTLGADARERIALVRSGLRSILDVLSKSPGSTELAELRRVTSPIERGAPPAVDRRGRPSVRPERMKTTKARALAARGKSSSSKRGVEAKRKRASA